MTPSLLLLCCIVALLMSCFAATAAKTLYEFTRHELEEFCKKRKRLDDYDKIIDSREQLALGAETLQIICLSISIVFGFLWLAPSLSVSTITVAQMFSIAGILALVILATNSWIPLATLNVAAAPFLYFTWRFWWWVTMPAKPLSVGFSFFVAIFQRASGQEQDEEDEEEAFEDEIRSMVSDGERDGFLDLDAREMIEGVINLDDTDVAEIMTPKKDIIAIDVATEWRQLLEFVSENNRTRIPVFENELSNVIGFLHTKDLLPQFLKDESERDSLRQLVRDSMFVPESLLIDELLQRFRNDRMHMAIVVDEYGSIAGLITIEDILEEIVGEIVDETEPEPEPMFQRIDENTIQTDGTTRLDELNDELGWELPENFEFDTVGGLMMYELKAIPRNRAKVKFGEFEFQAIGKSRRSVERVNVRKLLESELNSNGHGDEESAMETTGSESERSSD